MIDERLESAIKQTGARVLILDPTKVNKLEQAKKMLRELAETSTSVQSSEIFDMAEDLNISKRTLENAKKELGIKARRIGNS